MFETALAFSVSLIMSAFLTGAARRFALAHGVLDVPNVRSSHTVPTPRGGGVAIVAASIVGFAILTLAGELPLSQFVALAGGGVVVALIGFLDDRHHLSPLVRLSVHIAAAVWALAWLGGVPPMHLAGSVVTLGWTGQVLAVAGIVWTLNLFNFMDGIDGIAASEAAFIGCAGALTAAVAGVAHGVSAAALVVAAASSGFLIWNWPPARIFMGDVGSGYLGYVVAILALAATREDPGAWLLWLILGGAFFVDAFVTLVRRLARREKVHEAHRTHAYQWLSRRWSSHSRVTLAYLAINVCWLLPLALYAVRRTELSTWIAAAALLPLVVVALIAGAGRGELTRSSGVENRSNAK